MQGIVLEAAIRSLILAIVAWTTLASFRVINPLARLTVWTATLYVALAMPLLVAVRHALLPAVPVLPPMPIPPAVDAMMGMPAAGVPAVTPPAISLPLAAAPAHIPWLAILIGGYGFVALLLLLRLAAGLMRGWALVRRAAPVGDGLYRSAEVTGPVVFGSAIILPADSNYWPQAKRAAVLAHERSHIERGDFYVQLLAGVHRALFCFSPLGWWLCHELAALAELASDDAAAEAHGDRLSYAEILIDVARQAQPLETAVAMARGPEISRRIGRMVSGGALSIRLSHRQRAMIGGAGTMVVLAALAVTAATTSVAKSAIHRSPTQRRAMPPSRFAPVLATLIRLDRGPAQLADAVGALLQPTLAPTAQQTPAPPPAAPAAPVPLTTVRALGDDRFVTTLNGWVSQRLINPGPGGANVPTLGELKQLQPQQAAERMLAGMEHGPVASFKLLGTYGPVELMEGWTAVSEGCQRLDWTGQFLLPANGTPDSAWLAGAFGMGQIAKAEADGCVSARYALLGSGMNRELGFRALAVIEEVASGRRSPTLDCTSPAGRDICTNLPAFRAELLRPVHRLIQRTGYMNGPYQTDPRVDVVYNSVTKNGDGGTPMYMVITFDPDKADRLTVEDRRPPIPANRSQQASSAMRPPPPGPPLPSPAMLQSLVRLQSMAAAPAAPGAPDAPRPTPVVQPSAAGAKAYFQDKNPVEAARLLTPPAEQGDALSKYYLAMLYLRGEGVAHDAAKGLDLYRQVADSGDKTPYGGGTVSSEAMYQLGFMYENGVFGVSRSDAEAATWWRRWAATGDPRGPMVLAQRNLKP